MYPNTSVICAVWHQDPDRLRLLQGHQANLAAQTIPVEPIYVFDGNDHPPADLTGTVLVSREPLTIYQAWNLALIQVKTPYVINLNLDDRLSWDAIAQLESVMQQGADLVGGEWKLCYSQPDTDAVEHCQPADNLPFVETWPPRAGTITRLGSGTGNRGTLGPATMWSMALHGEFPRYPWKFADNSLIRTIGDSIWWRILKMAEKTIIRHPYIIGHYHSHPHLQAEFRNPADAEEQKLLEMGIELI